MSSGEKNLFINTRERAVSADINRIQSLIAYDRSQLARFQHNDIRQNTYQYPGVSTQNAAVGTPLSADIFGGLMVDPQTTSLLVTPGEIGCLFPDPGATSDDSPYMLISDPGVQTAGVLAFTANASGQIRIDLVECQPVAVTLESDNRDIFNDVTGLFTPVNVPKVKTFQLQYRIRTGVGGSGVPPLQSGWLPLAAIVVASGAADFSVCDFYDVRPLVSERVRPQPAYDSGGTFQSNQHSPLLHAEYRSRVSTGATLIEGYSENVFGGYLAGGWLRRSSPSFSGSFTGITEPDGDPDFINCSLAENQATGFSYAASAIRYLVAFFPAKLPRWVRYSHSAVGGGFGRVPKGPRGIVLVTNAGGYQNGVVAPMVIGHGFTDLSPGVMLGTIVCNSGGTDFIGVMARNGLHVLAAAGPTVAVTRTSGTNVQFALTAGIDHPLGATEMDVQLLLKFTNTDTVSDPGTVAVKVFNVPLSSVGCLVTPGDPLQVAVGSNIFVSFMVRIPLIANDSPFDTTSGLTTLVSVDYTSALFIGNVVFNTGANVQKLIPVSWRLGS